MNRFLYLLLLSICVFVLFSCTAEEKANVDRAVNVFFLGLLQIINLVIFGVSSFILCLLGMINGKKTLKIIGGALLGLFTLFMLLGLMAVLELQPRHLTVYVIFVFEVLIIGTNIVLLAMKSKTSPQNQLNNNFQNIHSDDQKDLLDF